jgi:hypothetical protein
MGSLRAKVCFCLPFLVAALMFSGCQAKPAPLNPEAAAFKQEIKDRLAEFSAALKEPVAKNDIAAINAALEKIESPAIRLCRLCPFQIGILNRYGASLAIYPPQMGEKTRNFSSYDLVTKVINTKKIQQQRFFLQNGSELYIICAPLLHNDHLIGMVAIAVNSADAAKRWGLTEKEFMGLNFNS